MIYTSAVSNTEVDARCVDRFPRCVPIELSNKQVGFLLADWPAWPRVCSEPRLHHGANAWHSAHLLLPVRRCLPAAHLLPRCLGQRGYYVAQGEWVAFLRGASLRWGMKKVTTMACPVCDDSGLLLSEFCPLCDGFGREGHLVWHGASTQCTRSKCLLARLLRTARVELTKPEHQDLAWLAMSRTQRRRRHAKDTHFLGPRCVQKGKEESVASSKERQQSNLLPDRAADVLRLAVRQSSREKQHPQPRNTDSICFSTTSLAK